MVSISDAMAPLSVICIGVFDEAVALTGNGRAGRQGRGECLDLDPALGIGTVPSGRGSGQYLRDRTGLNARSRPRGSARRGNTDAEISARDL